MSHRLPAPAGRLIDRGRPLRFTFDGRPVDAFHGDTIASALLAADRPVLSRSFKYHRPRGVLAMADGDANGLVVVDGIGNRPAERVRVRDGMTVRAQNTAGSARFDRLAILDRLGAFLPVGFYYKAFFRPRGAWARWEPLLRRLAGLGPAPETAPVTRSADHDHDYEHASGPGRSRFLHADVAVIGAGPAGMAAAIAAADAGARVLLAESRAVPGGLPSLGTEGPAAAARPIHRHADRHGDRPIHRPIDRHSDRLAAMVRARPAIRLMTETLCTGWFDDHWLSLLDDDCLYKLRAGAVVAATGTISQPPVFRNNDLPGIMLPEAVRRLIGDYGVAPGKRVVMVTAADADYVLARDLVAHGLTVVAMVDLRGGGGPPRLVEWLRARGALVYPGAAVWEAVPDRGAAFGPWRLAGVRVGGVGGVDRALPEAGALVDLACDLLVANAGPVPDAALICQAGARLRFDPAERRFALETLPAGGFVAGALAGRDGLRHGIADGRRAGAAAARYAGVAGSGGLSGSGGSGARQRKAPFFVPRAQIPVDPVFPHPKGRDFIDTDEDIQVKDILETARLGYDHIELAKRFSTATMGPSQGRYARLPLAMVMARATGRPLGAIGTTTFRPPLVPEPFRLLAGAGFQPVRRTPMHDRHGEAGARMMPAGTWLRPAHYGGHHPGAGADASAAIRAEALAVRGDVAMIDVSTLGGFEVRGPDAARFLNRIYTFSYSKQPVGRVRYVLMTDQTGVIVDDGVACRLAEDHFHVTATTGAAAAGFRQMLWWQAQWRMDVDLADVTAAYAGINIAGPRSRDVLAPLVEDIDMSAAAFPYLGVREGRVAGVPARLFRVGFVGELGYEIHLPANYGEYLWDRLRAAGVRPFGVEAQRLLRLEKGHIIVGQDTDGLTDPGEADMMWAVSAKKPGFVGRRALQMRAAKPPGRRLVGFEIADPALPMPAECHLVVRDGAITGRVTSVARSPVLDKIIGLAFVAPDQARPDSRILIKTEGGSLVPARVVKPPFYDPDNQRQDM